MSHNHCQFHMVLVLAALLPELPAPNLDDGVHIPLLAGAHSGRRNNSHTDQLRACIATLPRGALLQVVCQRLNKERRWLRPIKRRQNRIGHQWLSQLGIGHRAQAPHGGLLTVAAVARQSEKLTKVTAIESLLHGYDQALEREGQPVFKDVCIPSLVKRNLQIELFR